MQRRDALRLLSAAAMLPLGGACAARPEETTMSTPTTTPRMPVLFAAHGAPMLLDDEAWVGELAGWAKALPKPRSILMVSAHWEARPTTLGATTTLPLVYDFYGFPERFYEIQYASPGAPELAARVRGLLGGAGIAVADDPKRGLDHGAYVPLMCMYPSADVPVLQMSMPSLDAKELFALGRALAPLRDEGVLVVGSGFLTHNLRALRAGGLPSWASEFDAWTAEVTARNDVDALLDFEKRAPGAALAHPRTEHFVPVVVAAGAASAGGERPTFPIEGFWMGPFSKRSLQYG
jgi:4,5-DOPA dioxygenase extradiol